MVELSNHNHLPFTAELAAQVKRLWVESDLSVSEIATVLQADQHKVSDVINGRRYLDLPPAPF